MEEPTKKYILVAEDDKFYARFDKLKLTDAGFEVVIAENGEQLLKAARARKPDVILCDLIMPVKNGFETLAELQADPNLKDIPVIVFTSLTQEEDKNKVFQLGAKDYLDKTNFSFPELIAKIRSYLNL